MGGVDSKYHLTNENMDNYENQIICHSGLKDEYMVKKKVEVGQELNGSPIYIHTIVCGDENKPKMLFIHGYGACGALFYKIYKYLITYY